MKNIFFVLWVSLVVLLAVGWVKNIYALIECDFQASYKAEIIRGIGVFVPPVGAIIGWVHIEDGTS